MPVVLYQKQQGGLLSLGFTDSLEKIRFDAWPLGGYYRVEFAVAYGSIWPYSIVSLRSLVLCAKLLDRMLRVEIVDVCSELDPDRMPILERVLEEEVFAFWIDKGSPLIFRVPGVADLGLLVLRNDPEVRCASDDLFRVSQKNCEGVPLLRLLHFKGVLDSLLNILFRSQRAKCPGPIRIFGCFKERVQVMDSKRLKDNMHSFQGTWAELLILQTSHHLDPF